MLTGEEKKDREGSTFGLSTKAHSTTFLDPDMASRSLPANMLPAKA